MVDHIVGGPFAHLQRADAPPLPMPATPSGPGLPVPFVFSQQSLQDYTDCARRFQLRHIEGRRWPAAEAEPLHEHERLSQLGQQFHRLVQQHTLGLPVEVLQPADAELAAWWGSYLRQPPPNLPDQVRQAEVALSVPIAGHRLLARFDLLAIDPGQRAVIVDWKTSRRRPQRAELTRRWQSRVYPFVLVEAGAGLFGGPLAPEQVTLIYWFAAEPGQPEVLPYSQAQYEQDRADLTALISEITGRDAAFTWPLTEHTEPCAHCVYRSLCGRGVRAALLSDFAAELGEPPPAFNLDDIDEVAFG